MLDKTQDPTAPETGLRCESLRDALRTHTDADHRALDARLSTLNLLIPERRLSFCQVQLIGFRRLQAACGGEAAEASAVLARLIAALEAECAADPMGEPPATPLVLHPDAVAYVTLGAQLGTAMMRRALPDDQQTGYFALEPDMGAWRAFCDRMGARDPLSGDALPLLRDAGRAFEVFLAAAEIVLGAPVETMPPDPAELVQGVPA